MEQNNLVDSFSAFLTSQEKVEVNGKTQYMVKGQTCSLTESEMLSLFIKLKMQENETK